MRQWGGVGRKDFVSKSAFSQYLDLTDIMRPVYLEMPVADWSNLASARCLQTRF